MLRILCLLMVFILSFPAYSFSGQIICMPGKNEKKITLIFSKGANTNPYKAEYYAEETILRIKKLKKDNPSRMENFSKRELNEMFFVITQNEPEGLTGGELKELYRQYSALNENSERNEDGSIFVPDEKKQKIEDIFKDVDSDDGDFESQLALYKYVLEGISTPGHKFHPHIKESNAIIVSHSQGNMYYEAVYQTYLSKRPDLVDKYRVLSVGTPSKLTRYDAYVLDATDILTVLCDAFHWNTRNNISFWKIVTGEGHAYLTYLNGTSSKGDNYSSSLIMDNFFMNSIESMTFPDDRDSIRITLYKNGNPDIGLGVFLRDTIDNTKIGFAGHPDSQNFTNPGFSQFIHKIGNIEISPEKDVFTMSCSDFPDADFTLDGGVWNKVHKESSCSIKLEVDGRTISSKKQSVSIREDGESYQGGVGSLFTYLGSVVFSFFE